MSHTFLDTNVILRHLLNDDPALSEKARRIIWAIEEGTVTVWTSDLVIAEIVFVLSGKSTYNMSPQDITRLLAPLIQLPHLKLARKGVLVRALELFAGSRIGYVDAFNAAIMEHEGETHIYSFDRHFDRVSGIVRIEEPGRQHADGG